MDSPTKNETTECDGVAETVAALALATAKVDMVKIDTAGMGDGLPAEIPAYWDRDKQRLVGVADLVAQSRLQPRLTQGEATALTRDSFVELANRHKTDKSVVFAHTLGLEPHLLAVIDYHGNANKDPDWCRHKIRYDFPISDEMKAWVAGNKKAMEQLEFAHFLEDRAAELSSPTKAEAQEFEALFRERFADPSEMLELSRGLEIHVGGRIKQQERLKTGERVIHFDEEHTNAEGGPVDVPGIFMVAVNAFVDGDPVRIPARLRYRAGGGGVVWFYDLYRWEHWLRNRVKDDLTIVGNETKLPTFEGAPEV